MLRAGFFLASIPQSLSFEEYFLISLPIGKSKYNAAGIIFNWSVRIIDL